MNAKKPQGLSPQLKSLVRVVEARLGEVITEAEGEGLFDAVEQVRQRMVTVRDRAAESATQAFQEAQDILRGLAPRERAALARAYTIYLELVNLCENAYRTTRLRSRQRDEAPAEHGPATVVYVLTAHPTESRSPTNIALMRRAQELLTEALERNEEPDPDRLKHILHLVWRTGTHPPHKPTVVDEARHLYSLVSDRILGELIRLHREGHQVYLRTWVGGDKDGHPGVGPEETDASLNLSRGRLMDFVLERLVPAVAEDIQLLPDGGVRSAWEAVSEQLEGLRRVSIGDGRRVQLLKDAVGELATCYEKDRGWLHPHLADLQRLLLLFPGLVLPLELREERGLFAHASPIAHMLHYLKDVARGGQVQWYVRGLVVSMTTTAQDLFEAQALVQQVLGGSTVPIIPLFEMPDVLERATDILEDAFTDPAFKGMRREDWGLEVMLGYSDTSKRMGVLASRLAIHHTMQAIGAWSQMRGIPVVFFHGSGGSVGRGGGTIEERFATWPRGASKVVKETLQGEMVERTLSTPEILRSQVEKMAACQASPPKYRGTTAFTQELAELARQTFVEVVGSQEFMTLLQAATPYTRLGALNIGSRPVSRRAAGPASLEDLRAIPWVLCWTQTRYLLHAWLGVGSAWRELRSRADGQEVLLAAIREDPLLRSYLRLLGFTLAKTAPRVWREYVRILVGGESALIQRLEQEWKDALDLAQTAAGGELLAYRPWLKESIFYRAPMIHPLNLLQIDVLEQGQLTAAQDLFRETVTGVAAGMLTTG